MKLTIGMIVKNEESRLERCLDSIKPIIDNVSGELIITDTGSTDRTVEIAKKYTDNVLHFDWCDDFSAARNTAFSAAKGEWFMFVDADDVFAEYDDLIAFFNSGECEKYGSASFTYRNIRSEDKQDHIDQYVIRIVRRFPQTRFVGRIHEVLDPMPEPIKKLDTIVEHYGYFYDSGNDAAAKMKRNERILLKELEEAPEGERKSILLYYYLYEELREQETGKAEQYLDKGIEKALETKSDAIIPFMHEKARIYLSRGENERTLELCDRYFSLDTEMRAEEICADTEIYAVKAVALMRLKRYNEALDAFCEFFRLFDLVNSGKLVTGDRYIYLPALSGDGNLADMIARFTDCCDRCGNIRQMEQFVNTFPVSRYLAAERQADLFFAVGVLMKNGLDISHLLFGDDRQTALTASLCCDNITGFYDIAGEYYLKKIEERDKLPKAALLYEIIINKALKNNSCIDKLIQRFIDTGALYSGDSECEPIKLSRVIGQADADRKNGRYKECLAVLKRALNDFPDSVNPIKGYINIVSAELDSTQKTPVSSEMEKLAMMLKSNVKQMISAGKFDTAKKYLDEYAKIAPGDPEIEQLRNMMK